jgi:glutaredoxin-related protein
LADELEESGFERRIRLEFVQPFYLGMTQNAATLAPLLAPLARAAEVEEIVFMLEHQNWRMQKTGALFSLVRHEDRILDSLLESVRNSTGWLTFPQLSVAAYLLGGSRAVPAITHFQRKVQEWASAEEASVRFGSAVLGLLGLESAFDPPDENSLRTLSDQLKVADLIRNS